MDAFRGLVLSRDARLRSRRPDGSKRSAHRPLGAGGRQGRLGRLWNGDRDGAWSWPRDDNSDAGGVIRATASQRLLPAVGLRKALPWNGDAVPHPVDPDGVGISRGTEVPGRRQVRLGGGSMGRSPREFGAGWLWREGASTRGAEITSDVAAGTEASRTCTERVDAVRVSSDCPSATALQILQGCWPSKVVVQATRKETSWVRSMSMEAQAIDCSASQCHPSVRLRRTTARLGDHRRIEHRVPNSRRFHPSTIGSDEYTMAWCHSARAQPRCGWGDVGGG